jgi:hypothetical protein
VSSNPTNLVIAGAFSIPYFVYSAYMIFPAVIAAIFMFGALYLQFSIMSKRPDKILIPNVDIQPTEGIGEDAKFFVIDKTGAIIGSVLMLTTLAVLVATSPLKPTISVWKITVPGAALMFMWDIWHDWFKPASQHPSSEGHPREANITTPPDGIEMNGTVVSNGHVGDPRTCGDHRPTHGPRRRVSTMPTQEMPKPKTTLSSLFLQVLSKVSSSVVGLIYFLAGGSISRRGAVSLGRSSS